jgi:tRNA A37 threonylcarbamoyladenosine dehydratase
MQSIGFAPYSPRRWRLRVHRAAGYLGRFGQGVIQLKGRALRSVPEYLREHHTFDILTSEKYDFVVDCIDTLSPKVFLIKKCFELGLRVVSSMGAGGKVDPTQVQVSDLWKSYNCNLAYYVRKRLGQMGLKNRKLTVVWSPELADQSRIILAPEGNPKKSLIGTISYMPAVFGCVVSSVVIRELMKK